MALQIYNTETKKKEPFVPVMEGEVRMYVCGPTVYNFLHVGNFRGAIFFNAVRNWLEKSGYNVKYVYNFTDVDDKIIERAKETGDDPQELAERFIVEFKKDYEALKLRPHTENPRATEYIGMMVEFIQELEEKGLAYELDGDVYYHVPGYKDYGKLSNKNIEDMLSGTRAEVESRKRHPADFALWKRAKEGEPSWESPWGQGRPGWHIECSTMSRSLLGDTIDIHGGGLDLVFPHHENEIAQSEGCTGQRFVKYWMHNNMLEFGQQKMSKSLGNVRTGRDFLTEYNGEILKFMMLSAHYRSTIDFSDSQIERAIGSLGKIYSSMSLAKKIIATDLELAPVPEKFQQQIKQAELGIREAMDDDFNTPEVLARLFETVRSFNNFCRKPGKLKPEQKAVAEVYLPWLRAQTEVLALFQEEPDEYLRVLDDMLLEKKGLNRSEIDEMVKKRTEARNSKDWAASDMIRDELVAKGIELQDSSEGTLWEVAK